MDSDKNKIIQLKTNLKEKGLKLTHQRMYIYSELLKFKSHPTAEMVYKRVKKRLTSISLDTVYRTLLTLQEYGIIKKIDTTESQARFDADLQNHHHFICNKCNCIIDVFWPELENTSIPSELDNIGEVSEKTVTFHGICKSCL